jgi:hypothetical protein
MKRIINCETGEVTERELNKAEKDKQKLDEAEIAEALAIALAKEDLKIQARVELLQRLGITEDEAKLLLAQS